MPEIYVLLLAAGMFCGAVLYSSVGHAGASAYIALMALFGVAPAVMRPTALALNILVASLASFAIARRSVPLARRLAVYDRGGALCLSRRRDSDSGRILSADCRRGAAGQRGAIALAQGTRSQSGTNRSADPDWYSVRGGNRILGGPDRNRRRDISVAAPVVCRLVQHENGLGHRRGFHSRQFDRRTDGQCGNRPGAAARLALLRGAVLLGAVIGTTLGIRWQPPAVLKALGLVLIIAGLKLFGVY
jgi:uncharacterized protein